MNPAGPPPDWVTDLRVLVGRIDERTAAQGKQADHIASMVEHLQQTMVPKSAHDYLMTTVRELERQNVGAQSEWDEIIRQVPILWQERSESIGARRFRRWVWTLAGGTVGLGSIYNILHDAGLVTLGPHP